MAKRRKRGSGSVHLRKDGRWEGRAVIGYDDKGLPKTKNVLAKTKSECVQKLKDLSASIGKPEPATAKPGMTLGQWLDSWYQTSKKPNLRPNTQMSYEQRIYNYIIPALGDTPLDKLTQNDLQQFYTDLKQNGRIKNTSYYGSGLSDQTVRGCHTTLRSALEMAVSKKLISRNPADGCRLPPAKPREMQVLTPEEVQRLLIQAREDSCYELLLLEIATGLRRGELLALQCKLANNIPSISRIQDISIFVEDFAEDCMSDLLTNILRLPLSQFTAELMRTYDKTPTSKHIIKSWDLHAHSWVETEQPYWTVTGQKNLLVPKWWVRKNFLFKAHQYLYGVIIERMKMEPGYENLAKIDVWKNMERDFEHWEYAKVIEYTQRHPDALSDYHTRIPKYYNRSAGCMDDNDLDQAVYGRLISEIA